MSRLMDGSRKRGNGGCAWYYKLDGASKVYTCSVEKTEILILFWKCEVPDEGSGLD